MLWSAEADGAIDYCNQRVLDYTGLSPEQVRGAGWMKSVHQDEIEKTEQAWRAAVSTGEPFFGNSGLGVLVRGSNRTCCIPSATR
jgi:PAS domain S-box-containing protein